MASPVADSYSANAGVLLLAGRPAKAAHALSGVAAATALASGAISKTARLAGNARGVASATAVLAGSTNPSARPPAPTLTYETLNPQRVVSFHLWSVNGYYDRKTYLLRWDTSQSTVTVQIARRSWDSNNPTAYRPARTYTILVDGVQRGTVDAAAGAAVSTGTINVAGLAHGWHVLTIGGLADGETSPTYFAFMYQPGQPDPAYCPIFNDTYEMFESRALFHAYGDARYAWSWVPTVWTPVPVPLDLMQQFTPFSSTATPIRGDMLVLGEAGPNHMPERDRNGITCTNHVQPYYFNAGPSVIGEGAGNFISKYPAFPLLDGPRGVGTMCMVAHINIGTATWLADPASNPTNAIHALDAWRLAKIENDGHITTLAGWRHRGMGQYWEDADPRGIANTTLELVGNWEAIPPERRGFHELWGMAWNPATLTTDPGLPTQPESGFDRQPHGGNPTCFLTDTQNNRVCKVEFNGRDRSVPAVITEFLTGLPDPWSIVYYEGTLIVSERLGDRISQYDVNTGALLRVLIERNPALPGQAYIDNREMKLVGWSSSAAGAANNRQLISEARQNTCIAPEDLYELDGWLYWSSWATKQFKRLLIDDPSVVEVVFDLPPPEDLDGNSKYLKFAVSDGTFGPRGTLFYHSWSAEQAALGVLPDGSRWSVSGGVPSDALHMSYGAAVACARGRMYRGSAAYGIYRYYAGTPPDSTRLSNGFHTYKGIRGPLLYGLRGCGSYGQALPWGQDADLDYYLQWLGHTQPAVVEETIPVAFPAAPSSEGTSTYHYRGEWTLPANGYYDDLGGTYPVLYSVKKALPAVPRLCLSQHPSGGWTLQPAAVPANGDIVLRNVDGGQYKDDVFLVEWGAEWWVASQPAGVPYSQRRNAGGITKLLELYPAIDIDNKGIVVEGQSMGGGGVNATMVLPDPYRAKIAFARGNIPVIMYRQIRGHSSAGMSRWPDDTPANQAFWESIDFTIRAQNDPVVRGMHYRMRLSTTDPFTTGAGGSSSSMLFVNTCEQHKIGAAATWVANGHSSTEAGYSFPAIDAFEDAAQDVTLDRAHPCFTGSSGNYPYTAAQRADIATYPRGHYNLGLTWDWANIVDTTTEIVFPIKYVARAGFGVGIPDQASTVTVDVTPRRPRNFVLNPGELINWSWDNGAATGSAVVNGDIITATNIPLVTGQGYKTLRFFKPDAIGDVVVSIWGQSNAKGLAARADIAAPPLSSDPGLEAYNQGSFDRVWIWTGAAFAKLTPASNNQSSTTEFGPEFGLAVRWMRETQSGNLYLFKNAASGVSITSFEPGVGTIWNRGVSWWSQIQSWLGARDIVPAQKHLVWVQGEADYTQTQAWYQPRLENLMAAWTANGFLTPTSRVVLSQMPPGTSRYGSGVTAAKNAIAAANPGLVNALLLPAYMNADNLHYNGRGQVQHAYDVYAYLFDTTSSST